MQPVKAFNQKVTLPSITSEKEDSPKPVDISGLAVSQPLEELVVPLVSAALPKPVPDLNKISLTLAPLNPPEVEPFEGPASRHGSLQAASSQILDSSASQPTIAAALPVPEEAPTSQDTRPDEVSVEPDMDNVAKQHETPSNEVTPFSDRKEEVADGSSQTAHEIRQEAAVEGEPQMLPDSPIMRSEPSPKVTSEEQPELDLSLSDPASEDKTETVPGERTESPILMQSDDDTAGTNEVPANTAADTMPEEQPKAEPEKQSHTSQPEMIPEERKLFLAQTTPLVRRESRAEPVLESSPETAFQHSSEEVLPQEPARTSTTASEEDHRAVASSPIPDITEPQGDAITDTLSNVEQPQVPSSSSVVPPLAPPNTEAGSHTGSPKMNAAPASITIPSVLPVTLDSKPVIPVLPEGVILVNGDENVPSSLPEVQDTQESSSPLSDVSNTEMLQASDPERPSSPSNDVHKPSVTKIQDSPIASMPDTVTPEASSISVLETAQTPKSGISKASNASSPTLPMARVPDVLATDVLKPAAHSPDLPVSEPSEVSQIKTQSSAAVDITQSAALPSPVVPVLDPPQTSEEEASVAVETEVQDAKEAATREPGTSPEPNLPGIEPQYVLPTRISSPILAGVPESAVSEVSDTPIVDIPSAFPVEVPSSSISEISRPQSTVLPDQADANTSKPFVSETPRLSTAGSPGLPTAASSSESSPKISKSTVGEISRQPSIDVPDTSVIENSEMPITDLPTNCATSPETVVPQTEAAEVLDVASTEAPVPTVPEAPSSSMTEEPEILAEEIVGAPESLTAITPDIPIEVISNDSEIPRPTEPFPEVLTSPVLENPPLQDVASPDISQVEDPGLPIASSPENISPAPTVDVPEIKSVEVPSLEVTKASDTASDMLDSELPDTTAVQNPSVSVADLAKQTADVATKDIPVVATPVDHGLLNTDSLQLPTGEAPRVLSLRAKRSKRRRLVNTARRALVRKHILKAVLGRELGETTHAEMKHALKLSKGVPM